MKKVILASILFSLLSVFASQAIAVERITVLIIAAPGTSHSLALARINQLNTLMVNSGLPQYQFENAGDHMGAPGLVIRSVCNSTDHNLMLNCAILLHSFDRDSYDADIALMVAPQLSGFVCGAADPGAFNRPTISKNNHAFAFAAVALSCNLGNFFTASHEVLHLMNIEHRFGDIQVNTPVSYNHA